MSDIAIRVEGLGKLYRLGKRERYRTLRDTLVDIVASPVRRFRGGASSKVETIWALKDVGFELEHGEALAVIGRNGAGKSTLLKLLSRITEPTTGRATIQGRVGSLLEVGTGFHPELTGRENIYLNGAILGMKRADIQRNFDAIVDFAEVEKFIDTPVKHYSSGMYTRLAFSVAAHLEPEVLVVDEVLAVGDIGFQKKCLARMSDVAKQGRTVIFVSHNMAAVTRLCHRAIWLEDGCVKMDDDAARLVSKYQSQYLVSKPAWTRPSRLPSGDGFTFLGVDLRDSAGTGKGVFDGTDPIHVCLHYQVDRVLTGCQVGVRLYNSDGQVIFTSSDADAARGVTAPKTPGEHHSSFTIPGNFLAPGLYSLFVAAHLPYRTIYDTVEQTVVFEVSPVGSLTALDGRLGFVAPTFEWRTTPVVEREQVNCSL